MRILVPYTPLRERKVTRNVWPVCSAWEKMLSIERKEDEENMQRKKQYWRERQ